jgi:hypothetical protein
MAQNSIFDGGAESILSGISVVALAEAFAFYRNDFENYLKAIVEKNGEQIIKAVLNEALPWGVLLYADAENIINQLSFIELGKLLGDPIGIIFNNYSLLDAIKECLKPRPLYLFEHEIAKYVDVHEVGKYINVADAISQAFNLSSFSIESIFLSVLISPFIPSDDEALAYVKSEETKEWMLKDRKRRLDNLKGALALLKLGLILLKLGLSSPRLYDAMVFYMGRVLEAAVKDCYRQVTGRDPPEWNEKGKITIGTLLNMLMYRLRCRNCKSNASPEVCNPSELCQLLGRALMIHRNERNPVVHNEKFVDYYSEAQNIFSQFLQIIDGIIVKCRVMDAETHKNSEELFYSLQHILCEDRLELT